MQIDEIGHTQRDKELIEKSSKSNLPWYQRPVIYLALTAMLVAPGCSILKPFTKAIERSAGTYKPQSVSERSNYSRKKHQYDQNHYRRLKKITGIR